MTILYNEVNSRFEINFDSFIPPDQFSEYINFFKYIWLKYDPNQKVWNFDDREAQEKILWFDYKEIKYNLTEEAKNKLKELNNIESEQKFFRRKLDETVINKDIVLKDFQREDAQKLIQRNYALCAHCAGAGKTLLNIAVFSSLYKNNYIDGIIIIAPSSLCYNWFYEILKFVNVFEEKDITIISNETKVQPYTNFKKSKILIIPEHLFFHTIASYRKDYDSRRSFKNIQWKEINIREEWNKNSIAFFYDEAHGMRDSGSNKVGSILANKNQFNYKYCITASPFINHLEQSWSLINFFDKGLLPFSENAFCLWLAKDIGSKYNIYDINYYNEDHVDKFKEILAEKVIIKRTKEEIPNWKTELHIKTISLRLLEKHRKLYELIKKYEMEILENQYDVLTYRTVINAFSILLQVLDNPFLLSNKVFNLKNKDNNEDSEESEEINSIINTWNPEKDDSKFKFVKESLFNYIEELGKKVILYIMHPKTGDFLFDYFKDYNPLLIHGEIKVKDKMKNSQEVVDAFNNRDENRLLILSALTTSSGVSLEKKCSNIIIVEQPLDSTHFLQIQSRTDRITSLVDSLVEIPYFPGTWDQVRINRSINRVDFNEKLNRKISRRELDRLLMGIL